MRLTPLLALRSLSSKIPVPTTPREARQLLATLQNSFQRQLDHKHPPPRPSAAADAGDVEEAAPWLANASANAANNHILSLLNHPALAKGPISRPNPMTKTRKSITMFDDDLFNGSVTLASLRRYVELYKSGTNLYNTNRPEDQLGPRIASWFASAHGCMKKDLLTSYVLGDVMQVLYKDGLEDTVWEWLRILYEKDFGVYENESGDGYTSAQWCLAEQRFIRNMVKNSIQKGKLDEAILEYIHAYKFMLESGRLSRERWAEPDFVPLRAACSMINYTILKKGHGHSVSADLFNQLLNFNLSALHISEIGAESVRIYHPTMPSADELCVYLSSRQFIDSLPLMRQQSQHRQTITVAAMLDGAQLLSEKGEVRKAQYIVSIIEKQFPKVVSSHKVKHPNHFAYKTWGEFTVDDTIPAKFAF